MTPYPCIGSCAGSGSIFHVWKFGCFFRAHGHVPSQPSEHMFEKGEDEEEEEEDDDDEYIDEAIH